MATTQAEVADIVKSEVARIETNMEDNAVKAQVCTSSFVTHSADAYKGRVCFIIYFSQYSASRNQCSAY
jgi:hypothetical protein